MEPQKQSDVEEFIKPDCPRCKGVGWLTRRRTDGSGHMKAEAVPCDALGCYLERWTAARSGMSSAKGQCFENFIALKGTEEALEACKSFSNLEGDFIWLLLYGAIGSGKTHLANAVVRRACSCGIDCRLFSVPDLLSEMRRRMAVDREVSEGTLEAFVAEVKAFEMLVLDDFGAELQTDWAMSRLEEILDSRYRNLRATMVTTNLNPTQLPPRLHSRFCERDIAQMVLNAGDDHRKRT